MRARRAVAAAAAATLTAALAACAANPGPPPLIEPEELEAAETSTVASTSEKPPARTEVQVGVDPVRAGYNPHLLADDQATVRSIADLVLPSAFIDGERNADLLVAASRLATSPEAMTVRYIIAPEAQWSDGTPISGEDFVYLWRGMRTTPGTINPAGYDAIAAIRISGASGKTVDVDFRVPVRHWRELFTHLLPAHLLSPDAADFATALRDAIPASAGRYLFSGVEGGSGTITLNRNDRFWGEQPATIDILTLHSARDTTQMADQLRSHQLAFVDKIPEEATRRAFELVPNTQVQLLDAPRTLGLTISADVDPAARAALASLVDAPLLATIATNRSTDLAVADAVFAAPAAALPAADAAADADAALAAHGTLRIAADPSDPAAAAAARSLVDLLAQRQVAAKLVSTDTHTIMARGLPGGQVDAVVGWRLDTGTATEVAGRAACPAHAFRAANVAGFCTPETEALAAAVLAGDIPAVDAAAELAATEANEALWVPIVHETRIQALGTGIAGPDPELARWPDGLATAGTWRLTQPKE